MPPKLPTPKISTPKISAPKISAPKLSSPKLKAPSLPAAPDWRRALETGMQFTELRRSQARAIANDLVNQGHLAREQVASAVDELVDMSRKRSDALRKLVQDEVQKQLGALGLATKRDLAALERRVTKAARETKRSTAAKAASKKAPAKKKAAAKSTRKAG